MRCEVLMMTNSRACGRARVVRRAPQKTHGATCVQTPRLKITQLSINTLIVNKRQTIRFVLLHIDYRKVVKVVIFRNIFARSYRNMRGINFFFLLFFSIFFFLFFLAKRVRRQEKSARWAASQIRYQGKHWVWFVISWQWRDNESLATVGNMTLWCSANWCRHRLNIVITWLWLV